MEGPIAWFVVNNDTVAMTMKYQLVRITLFYGTIKNLKAHNIAKSAYLVVLEDASSTVQNR